MKSFRVLLVIMLFLAVCPGCKKKAQEDRVIATVNNQRVLESELVLFEKIYRMRTSSGNASELDKETLLNKLIERKIVLAEAARQKISVSDKEVNDEIKKISTTLLTQDFKDTLKNNGLTFDEWKRNMTDQVLFEKTITGQGNGIEVSEKEIKDYYESHRKDYTHGEQAHAYQIVCDNKAAADNIKKELERGADFEAMARSRSSSPDRDAGGDMGFVERDELPPDMAAEIFRTDTGKLSNVVKSDYGFHVFFVKEKKKKGTASLEEVKQIIEDNIRQGKTDKFLKAWLKDLGGRTNVKINKGYMEEIK